MKRIILSLFALVAASQAFAQLEQPVKWSYVAKRVSPSEAVVYIKATIDEGWHLYSQKPYKVAGPVNTTFTFNRSKTYTLVGKTTEPAPVTKFEKSFKTDVFYFENEVIFQQKVKLSAAGATNVTGKFEYMVCDDTKCLPPEEVKFSIPVKAAGK